MGVGKSDNNMSAVRFRDEPAEGGTVPATAVFDLDGTLLDGDSTSEWMRGLLRRSVAGSAAALRASGLDRR